MHLHWQLVIWKHMELPNKKYSIILADPPWSYKDKSKSHGGGAESHYSCMELNDICSLHIDKITNKNCILFIWVTMPFLQDCFNIIKAWGFVYKTCGFVWIKTNKRKNPNQYSFLPEESFDDFMGMGRWTRSNVELCLIAIKGKMSRINASIRQIVYSPVEEHSKKPDIVRRRIVELCGDKPRIELFARQRVEGWDSWGDEI